MEASVENSTKKKILFELKKNGSMSVDGLSKRVNVTPMGVRQHLLALERNGIVEYNAVKHGVGRPGFLYKLTEKADDLFPKGYQELLMDVLADLEDKDGKNKIDDIFKRRKERVVAGYLNVLSGIDDRKERLLTFADTLRDSGCLVEIDEKADHYTLAQFNCPISRVARRFKAACDYELEMLTEILGKNIVRQQCLSAGDQACVYVIPK